ncbi:DUF2867 domain-containing protein [Chryseobacterium sp. KMC2]|uniref:DUF2867 domain-containing protein n=1 Tax=Chryseobacterium sp. KMC2 TaxID=2800705 RepID=UPI0019229601|nr:DUF2867 domain-containing protein [Chryseobacterium sp. KMC2]MBL3548864.1 DUF2867 domain-containing protein [Chryseobacterium sp. KMC2]
MNLKVNKVNVDKAFLVNKYLPANYADAFECVAPISDHVTPDHLQIAFWGSEKSWIKALFELRNMLVKPFGLKTSRKEGTGSIAACIEKGTAHPIASVSDRSSNETILLLDDKHLKAYISMSIAESEDNLKRVTVCTIVHFHNWFGYLYFHSIDLFHSLVVRNMLKRSIRANLQKNYDCPL